MSLAREIAAALPRMMADHPKGPRVKDIAAFIAAPEANVRRALDAIKSEGLAIVVRWPGEKGRRVVPLGHDFGVKRARACKWCDLLFEAQPKSKRLCCSIQCKNSWTWANPETRARRMAGIKAERATPKAKARLAAHNKRRWAKPGEREKMSEQNKREWAEPVKRAKRAASIQAVNGSPKMRRHASEIKKRQWRDPEYREKTVAGLTRQRRTPEARAKFSALLRERWKDPVMRAKYTAHNKRLNAERAERLRKQWADPQRRRALLAKQRANAAKARETRLAAPLGAVTMSVLAMISAAPGPLPAARIKEALNLSNDGIRNALRVLERRGLLERCACGSECARGPGGGSGSSPKIAWRLARKARAKAA